MKTTILPSRNSMNRLPLRLGFLPNALALAIAWLAPWQLANAQCPQICNGNLQNTAFGLNALPGDSGPGNTAMGDFALFSNISGGPNTAIGAFALYSNTTGSYNTAIGVAALQSNTTGWYNTASGLNALVSNTTGSDNTATGYFALWHNTNGSNNIAVSYLAGWHLTTGSHNIDIGNAGVANESGKIHIGTNGTHTNTFIAGISGVTVANGVGVIIDTRGHLGTVVSSERFKDEIKPMDKAS